MKFLISAFLILITFQASATSDALTRAYIVVQDVQDPEEFFVERVPVIGCYGVSYGPQLVQLTAPYKVSSKIGCGGEQFFDEINYLTCAKVTETNMNATGSELLGLTLDISNCAEKNNPQLITMIRTAAKLNFPQANKAQEVQLKIITGAKK